MMRKMKDSGIAWIGEIPEECDIMRTSRAYSSVLGKMVCSSPATPADEKLSYICAKDVHFDNVDFSDLKMMWFSPKEQELYSLAAGDLLVVEGGAGAGGAATIPSGTDVHGICFQNSLHRIRATSDAYDTRYLMYYIGMLVQGDYVDYVCNKATIPHFTKDKIMSIPLVRWPIEQQRAIVTFLDAKCSAMDEAIRKAERLIEKLDAFKQSLITETVTKGLHPEVARKDSGVEWIGEIPASWKMERLKFLAEVKTGPFGTQLKATEYVAEGTPCINVKNIGYGSIKSDDLDFVPPSVVKRLNEHILRPGDIVFARKGSIDKHAITTESESGWLQGSDCIRVRLQADLDHNFFNYYLANSGLKYYLASLSNGATMASLNGAMIEDLLILLPTAVEQREIASFLDTKCAAIDADIAKRRALMERLSAYKRSLIYEVVTGKREV